MLSYNKVLNFLIGNRGGGKTFGFKEWSIKDFKKTGRQFIYMRRFGTEFDDMAQEGSDYFSDIRFKFPNDELEIKGDKAYINGEIAGYMIPLSTSTKRKSTNYNRVNKIIFDEFIIDKGVYHYIKNEVQLFLEFFETVARMRDDVRAIFIANAISIVNPYFLFWNVKPKNSVGFTVNDHMVIEVYMNQEYVDKKKQTRYGQLIDGTEYGSYAMENKFLRDSDTFIAKKTPNADFMCGLKYEGVMYGFWVDYNAGYVYVNKQYDPSSHMLFSLSREDHAPNMLMIKSLHDNKSLKRIIYCFQNGLLRFQDQAIKKQAYEFLGLFLR